MAGGRSGSSKLLLAGAALALVALVCVVVFMPWSVSSSCASAPGPCDPNTAIHLIKFVVIVLLGALALVALVVGLSPDQG